MTYEELLAICDNYSFKDSTEPVKALRAVVELHKPKRLNPYKFVCNGCYVEDYINWVYPCPTIKAIKEQLK